MSRAAAAALVLALAFATVPGASAQVMGEEVTSYPIRDFLFLAQAGVAYEFRTTGRSPGADTVLSLRTGGSSGGGASLAGADGCAPVGGGTFTWGPSCFSYTSPTTTWLRLWLYAYYDAYRGQATVQYRTLPSGAWTNIVGSASFGGHRAAFNPPSGTGRVLIETVFRPGNVSAHSLVVASAAALGTTRFATYSTGRNAFGTAQMDVNATSAGMAGGSWWVYFGGRYVGEVGNTRLVRNDYFVSGNDLDGDGLSLALEAGVGSCDRPSQNVGTFSCRNVGSHTHPECNVTGDNIAGDAECLDSLRDTDHDGIRDDIEVYGFGGTMNLPRYGADPGRMDIFVELDAGDQDLSTPFCDGFSLTPGTGFFPQIGDPNTGDGRPARDFIEGNTLLWASGPSWRINPSGASGVAVHYDVGLAAPDPRETRYGAWGGGNTCVPGSCSLASAYGGGCGAVGAVISDARKWLFSWGIDWPPGTQEGSATPLSGSYYANHLGGHFHELGHLAGLVHEGPFGTAEGSLTCTGYGNTWVSTNGRPHFLSRMNYRYSYVGGVGGELFSIWDGFSFSSGGLVAGHPSGGMSDAAAPEICPFPGRNTTDLYYLGIAQEAPDDDIALRAGAGGCADVNWDADLTGTPAVIQNFESASTHVWVNENRRVERRRYLEPWAPTPGRNTVGPSGAAIVNDVLLYAYRVCDAAGTCEGRLRGESSLWAAPNGDCSIYPINPDSAAWLSTEGSYPSCFRPGTAVTAGGPTLDPESLAVIGYRADGGAGTPDRAAIVLMSGSGGIYYSLFNPQPAGTPTEFSGAPGTFVSTGIFGATGATFRDLTMARVPGTNDLLVVYHTAAGSMRQFAIDPDASTVTASATATDLGGTALGLSTTAASMAEVDGRVFLVRNVTGGLELLRLAASGAVHTRGWETMRTLPSLPGSTPTIVRSLEYGTTTSRVYVYGQLSSGAYWFHRAPVSTTWYSPSSTWELTRVYATGEALAVGTLSAVYDNRSTLPAGTRGLRVLRTREWVTGVYIEHDPFGDGADPSVALDHDEWDGLQWGICRTLQQRDALSSSVALSSYVPTPYADSDRCGDFPNYYLATPTSRVLMTRGNGHRFTTPGLYPGGMTCPSGP